MLAFLQTYLGLPALYASACAPRVLRVSIRLMKSDDAILITLLMPLENVEFQDEQFGSFGKKKVFPFGRKPKKGSNSVPD
jgi:hypothetical protein